MIRRLWRKLRRASPSLWPEDFDVWVDFNDVGEGHDPEIVSGFARRVVAPGDKVIAGDDEGNRCPAEVINYCPGFASVRLDLSKFRPPPKIFEL